MRDSQAFSRPSSLGLGAAPAPLGPERKSHYVGTSVPDPEPNPDPPDPNVFGPPGAGSGSISQRYGSGSRSFYRQAKIVRKTLIPTVL